MALTYFTRGFKALSRDKTVTLTTEIHDDGFMITIETRELNKGFCTEQVSRSTLGKALTYITNLATTLQKEGMLLEFSKEKPHKVIYDGENYKFKISI